MYRELKMKKDDFFVLVNELGFDIGERAIKIDDAVAVKIIQAIREKRRRGRKKSLFANETPVEEEKASSESERLISIPEKISVKDFAQKLGKSVPECLAILLRNGIMASINETLDYETATIIAEDAGFRAQKDTESEEAAVDTRSKQVEEVLAAENDAELEARAPVVVIMGHVDHGKTTLLDTIRSANVTAGEAGGITQHIGAYQVVQNDRPITFIDTPGHEAFTMMRSRGARVADIAILVVAADDGIKPQTIEAVHIIQEAGIPFVVAINKIDKPDADIDRVKKELAEINLIPEEWGGTVICTPVSAKNKTNIDGLLDTILLVADVEADKIRANPKGEVVGTIIEAHVDAHMGPVATILVQNGTLRISDVVQIGGAVGRVRSLKDWNGKDVKTAGPATPVKVLGLKSAPVVGDILTVSQDKKALKKAVKQYNTFAITQQHKKRAENVGKNMLPVVLRADTLGSLEAIVAALGEVGNDEVGVSLLQKGLGNVTENDIALARSSGAVVIAFHTSATSGAVRFASDEKIALHEFAVIYQLLDFIKGETEKLLTKKITYNKIGSLKLLAVFKTEQTYCIAGGRVEDGSMKPHTPLKIVRGGKVIGEGILSQLQKDKKNVGEVGKGSECGMRIDTETALQENDIIESYEVEETSRSL